MTRATMTASHLQNHALGAEPIRLDQKQVAKSGLRPHIGPTGVIFSAEERHHLMTMFSMKPKFNLVEFLAQPAPVGTARSRNARRGKTQFQLGAKSEGAAPPKPADATEPSDTAK